MRITLLTLEADQRAAYERALQLLGAAAARAELPIEEFRITGVAKREQNITGRPRRVDGAPTDHRIVEVQERGRLCVTHDRPPGEWTVWMESDPSRAWAGRSLTSVLCELWELRHLGGDSWARDEGCAHRPADVARRPLRVRLLRQLHICRSRPLVPTTSVRSAGGKTMGRSSTTSISRAAPTT